MGDVKKVSFPLILKKNLFEAWKLNLILKVDKLFLKATLNFCILNILRKVEDLDFVQLPFWIEKTVQLPGKRGRGGQKIIFQGSLSFFIANFTEFWNDLKSIMQKTLKTVL